jgi:NAD(P)-dependent dehydrogenase (short-subunit alcohol dehydrogenase family)
VSETGDADASQAAGRTFLVTGANTGIGRATAAGLARQGGRVFVASRSREKGEEAVAGIKASTGNGRSGTCRSTWPTWIRCGPALRPSWPGANRCTGW